MRFAVFAPNLTIMSEKKTTLTEFVVTPRIVSYESADTHRQYYGLEVGLRRDNALLASYLGLQDLSRTTDCQALLNIDGTLKQVDWPSEMNDRLAGYLRREKQLVSQIDLDGPEENSEDSLILQLLVALQSDISDQLRTSLMTQLSQELARVKGTELYDCASFVYEMNGLKQRRHGFIFDDWEIVLESEAYRPGRTVVFTRRKLYEEEKGSIHVAIYIGHGLYLSKLGLDKLGVTDLKNLSHAFMCDLVIYCKPKEDAEKGK